MGTRVQKYPKVQAVVSSPWFHQLTVITAKTDDLSYFSKYSKLCEKTYLNVTDGQTDDMQTALCVASKILPMPRIIGIADIIFQSIYGNIESIKKTDVDPSLLKISYVPKIETRHSLPVFLRCLLAVTGRMAEGVRKWFFLSALIVFILSLFFDCQLMN